MAKAVKRVLASFRSPRPMARPTSWSHRALGNTDSDLPYEVSESLPQDPPRFIMPPQPQATCRITAGGSEKLAAAESGNFAYIQAVFPDAARPWSVHYELAVFLDRASSSVLAMLARDGLCCFNSSSRSADATQEGIERPIECFRFLHSIESGRCERLYTQRRT